MSSCGDPMGICYLPVDMEPLRFTLRDYSVPPSPYHNSLLFSTGLWYVLHLDMPPNKDVLETSPSTNGHPTPPVLSGASLSSDLQARKKHG